MEYSFNCGGSGGLAPQASYCVYCIAFLFISRPVNLSKRIDRSTGKHIVSRDIGLARGKNRSAGHYGYFVLVHLSTCQPVYQDCFDRSRGKYRSAGHYGYFVLVHLSTCLPGRTCPDVNILYIGIMGIPYLFICQPESRALWIFRTCPPVDMSTCLPELTGPEVNIGVQGIMGILYLFTCRPVNLSTCLPGLTGQEVNIGVQGIIGILYLSTC